MDEYDTNIEKKKVKERRENRFAKRQYWKKERRNRGERKMKEE